MKRTENPQPPNLLGFQERIVATLVLIITGMLQISAHGPNQDVVGFFSEGKVVNLTEVNIWEIGTIWKGYKVTLEFSNEEQKESIMKSSNEGITSGFQNELSLQENEISRKVMKEKDKAERIYTRAEEGTCRIPSELGNFRKTRSPLNLTNAESFGFDPTAWQSDPSRIIYHKGKYHCWLIDGYIHPPRGPLYDKYLQDGKSWILYMNSEDSYNWTAVHRLPLGPKGSAYDEAIEQANVLYHKGRFYLFSEGFTSNIEKYGQQRAGIICLVADSPEGPWKQVGDLLLKGEMDDGRSWDSMFVVNPRHVYLNGKWFMYYKARRGTGGGTENGLAIADSLTGPYTKYEGNPILWGHGHFCWRYKHGMLMLPFAAGTLCKRRDKTGTGVGIKPVRLGRRLGC